MIKHTWRWPLYWWGDRPYEGCYAIVTMNLPDNWENEDVTSDQIEILDLKLEESTETFLLFTYCTNIQMLTDQLKKDLPKYMDDLIEGIYEDLEFNSIMELK